MIKFIQKWFLGWLGVYMHNRKERRHRVVDWVMRKFLSKGYTRRVSPEFFDEYGQIVSRTKYWHGTGRYQYADGTDETINVLASILDRAGLRPQNDVFDISMGDMSSVSCTNIRMYARIYADMHQFQGVKSGTRYGAAFVWGYYFIVSAALMAIQHMGLWKDPKKRHLLARGAKENMKGLWVRKVLGQKYVSLKDFFVNGSDIAGNYGILIGLKSIGEIATTSPYISMYETRTSKMIPATNWSHIEAPKQYVNEVSEALREAKINIPVYTIEDCEQYWSQKDFSLLVK